MKSQKRSSSKEPAKKTPAPAANPELVIITGLSGSGKGTVLKALEDFGYYSVDNLPVDLIPKFAELSRESPKVRSAALVVDIREGDQALAKFPRIFKQVRKTIATRLVFLEADDDTIIRRFSETRRPHPLGRDLTVANSVQQERKELAEIRDLADFVINTSKLNVHQLRELIQEKFHGPRDESKLQIYVTSFGFRHGVPTDSDLVFDVRFLPNPNYIPEFKPLTGLQPKVAKYIRGYPQTVEFLKRISDLLVYLIPHYIAEGKSYLTISFGCTGGHHRSVMMAHEIKQHLARQGYRVKESHRDIEKAV
ncbi:nucleotide-binding protein [Bryobacterales bacterium F-183]|nr:nucleotide-binding protein [Bryobacterales bacterium F-183]